MHDIFRYLENEIHKTNLKLNEADMIKKKYELILDMLKKERLNYTKQITKMESFEAEQMKEIATLEKDYEEAVEFRDEIRGEQKDWEDHFIQQTKTSMEIFLDEYIQLIQIFFSVCIKRIFLTARARSGPTND